MTDEPDRYDGVCVITWPSKQHASGVWLPTWPMKIADARTGALIVSVVRLCVLADFEPRSDSIVAELTMLCDPDGNPYLGKDESIVLQADGTIRTETFRYLVSEMRLSDPAGTEHAFASVLPQEDT